MVRKNGLKTHNIMEHKCLQLNKGKQVSEMIGFYSFANTAVKPVYTLVFSQDASHSPQNYVKNT